MSDRTLRLSGFVCALALVAIQAAVSARAVWMVAHRDERLARPFALTAFRPVIASQRPRGQDLYWTDRILAVDGRPVRNRADVEDALREGERRGGVVLLVEHYPRGYPPWTGQAYAILEPVSQSAAQFEAWGGVSNIAWFGFVIWPSACVLLAAAALIANGASGRAWLAAGALAGMAQLAWLLVSPYEWNGAARAAAVVYNALAGGIGPLCLFWIALNWPTPLWGERAARKLTLVASVAMTLWALTRLAVRTGELVSYRLTEPFAWLERPFGLLNALVPLVCGAVVAMRTWTRAGTGLTNSEQWTRRVLWRGSWALTGSLGVYLIVLPWVIRNGQSAALAAFGWLAYAMSLGWPLAVAVVGSRADQPLRAAALETVEGAASWRALFDALAPAVPADLNLKLLAVYGKVEGELRVRAGSGGVRSWAPVGIEEQPPFSNLLHWQPMEIDSRRVGFLVFAKRSPSAEFSACVRGQLDHFALQAARYAERAGLC